MAWLCLVLCGLGQYGLEVWTLQKSTTQQSDMVPGLQKGCIRMFSQDYEVSEEAKGGLVAALRSASR